MSVVIWNSSPDWNAELYDQTVTKAFGGPLTPDALPEGNIAHFAMPRPGGGFQVIEVWDTEEAYQRFAETTLVPAVMALNAPPFDSKVIAPHAAVVR